MAFNSWDSISLNEKQIIVKTWRLSASFGYIQGTLEDSLNLIASLEYLFLLKVNIIEAVKTF